MAAVTELASEVGASAACQVLCMPRASYYRDRRKDFFPGGDRVAAYTGTRTPSGGTRIVLACLHQERFQDRSPARCLCDLTR